jgi:glycosyltransferase involved in cell wall biosynthesis
MAKSTCSKSSSRIPASRSWLSRSAGAPWPERAAPPTEWARWACSILAGRHSLRRSTRRSRHAPIYPVPAILAPATRQLRTSRTGARLATGTGARILFDISDLVYYIGEHANLTGIQRVQSSIVLAILNNEIVPQSQLVFLSFNAKTRNWVVIPTGFLATLLEDLFLSEPQRLVSFPAEEARYGMLPGARAFDGTGVLDDGHPSVLCLLGAAWVHQDYLHRVLALKRRFGTKFVMTVHDLIPIYARETCDQDTARVFEEFMRRALRHADHILSVSENTARDVRRYARSLTIPEPPITVTRNGSSFAEFLPKGMPLAGETDLPALPERFVLFVATIEGRKNHQLMLDIWRRMIADGDDPPHLVCVGRLGWKSSAFISVLVETDYLGGRVHLLRDICDADLRLLYSRCLFTVCPTLYEGWGLPVGESLAMGKICVSSDRASVPEVAGEFGVYIDIGNFEQSLETIRGLIADPAARRKLEQKIGRFYTPITWHSVAEKVVAACRAAPETEWQEPYPYAAIPYSTEISFGRLDRDADGTGEALLARIAKMRHGHFLREPLGEQNFLWGEEARSAGSWAYPEDWGTWACHAGGELALGLATNQSQTYFVCLRLRASGPMIEHPIRISADGETVWHNSIGPRPRNIVLRVRRRAAGKDGWRLRLRAETDLSPELQSKIATEDSRIPTIGFERLVIVPEDDLKTRVDILYSFFCD